MNQRVQRHRADRGRRMRPQASAREAEHGEWSWVVLALRHRALTLDGLRRISGRFLPAARLLAALMRMEAAGLLRRQPCVASSLGVHYGLTDLGEELALFILHARRTLRRAEEEAARPRPNADTPDEASLALHAYKGLRR